MWVGLRSKTQYYISNSFTMDGPIFLISISQFWWNNLDRTINILPRIKHLGVSACMYESILCMTESVNQSSNKDKYYIFLDKKKKT